MSRWSQRLVAAALLCALVLVPAAAQAARVQQQEAVFGSVRPIALGRTLMEVMRSVWRAVGILSPVGVVSDPNGPPVAEDEAPQQQPSPVEDSQGDVGVISDPNG